MLIVIAGAGKVGANLAIMLHEEGHQTVLVERDADRVVELDAENPGLRVVPGNACEPMVLEIADIARADAVAAVTGCDEDNLVICLLARREFGVRVTAARINDPRNEWLFDKRFGVDHTVSGTRSMAKLFTREVKSS